MSPEAVAKIPLEYRDGPLRDSETARQYIAALEHVLAAQVCLQNAEASLDADVARKLPEMTGNADGLRYFLDATSAFKKTCHNIFSSLHNAVYGNLGFSPVITREQSQELQPLRSTQEQKRIDDLRKRGVVK